ncbi:MAG: DUF2569 family protein [Candidatus Acidiferrales bacterium]
MVFTPTHVPLPLKGVGGWLTFFIFTVVVLGPLNGISSVALAIGDLKRMYGEFPAIHSSAVFHFLDKIASVAVRVSGIVVGIRLWKIRPRAVEAAKLWLTMVALLAFGQMVVGLSTWIIEAHGSFSAAAAAHPNNQDVFLRFARSIIYSLIWYAYFVRSERVANTYPVVIPRTRLEGATP